MPPRTGVGCSAAGGSTAVPRWTTDPQPGVAEHVAPIPGDVLTALEATAGHRDLPLGSVLLAAHAAVLAALTGEPDVVTEYVPAPGAAPLPCRCRPSPVRGGSCWDASAGCSRSCWRTPASRSSSCGASRAWPGRGSRRSSTRPAGRRARDRRRCCGWGWSRPDGTPCFGCGTGATCWTPRLRLGSRATTCAPLELMVADPGGRAAAGQPAVGGRVAVPVGGVGRAGAGAAGSAVPRAVRGAGAGPPGCGGRGGG